DTFAAPHPGRSPHVGVEIAAILALAVDQEVVAVEDGIEAATKNDAGSNRHQPRSARGDDVKPFVRPAAIPRSPEFTDRAAGPVRAQDREDVAAVLETARSGSSGGGGNQQRQRRNRDGGGGAPYSLSGAR